MGIDKREGTVEVKDLPDLQSGVVYGSDDSVPVPTFSDNTAFTLSEQPCCKGQVPTFAPTALV